MEDHQLGSLIEQTGSWFISDSDTPYDDPFNPNFASDESDYSFLPDGDSFGSMGGYAIPGGPPTPAPTTPVMPGAYLSPPASTSYGQYPGPDLWSMGPMTPASTPMYQAHQAITSQWQFGEPSPRLTGASWFDNQFAITQAPVASQAPLSPPPTLPSPSPTDERASHISRAQRRRIQRNQTRQPRRRKTPPPRVSCDVCLKEVADDRSLGRHRWEKHGIPGAPATDDGTGHGTATLQKFKCRCGYESPRRSNYLRHLNTCDTRKWVDDKYFRCECGGAHEGVVNHREHIAGCGKKKVGRPAKADNSETGSSHSSSLLSRQVSQQSHYTI